MIKKLMKQFKEETGKSSEIIDRGMLRPSKDYIKWLEEKVETSSPTNKYDTIIGIVDSCKDTKHPHLVGKAGEVIDLFKMELIKQNEN